MTLHRPHAVGAPRHSRAQLARAHPFFAATRIVFDSSPARPRSSAIQLWRHARSVCNGVARMCGRPPRCRATGIHPPSVRWAGRWKSSAMSTSHDVETSFGRHSTLCGAHPLPRSHAFDLIGADPHECRSIRFPARALQSCPRRNASRQRRRPEVTFASPCAATRRRWSRRSSPRPLIPSRSFTCRTRAMASPGIPPRSRAAR